MFTEVKNAKSSIRYAADINWDVDDFNEQNDNIDELGDELEEKLHGDCIAGFITKKEMNDISDSFTKWAETAKIGDEYTYDDLSLILAKNSPELPCKVKIPVDVDDEQIADYLSDEYGYCVNSYVVELSSSEDTNGNEEDIIEYGSEIDFTDFTIDTTSEYIVDGHYVNVMLLPTDDLLERFELFAGGNIEYVDFYAYIDARVNLVTKVEAIFTADTGNEKRAYIFDIPVESQAWMFMHFLDTDKDNLEEVLNEARASIHENLLSDSATIIEYFEDFLKERGIKVPTSEKLKKEAGDDEDNDAVIYGEDYAELENAIYVNLSGEQVLKKQWWEAYYTYASDPANAMDELDFVSEAIERGITEQWLKAYRSEELTTWFKNFALEHGLI